MAKSDTQDAIVAPRKSVDVGGVVYGPGQTVTLSADDVTELRGKGFLVDPNAIDDADDGGVPSVSITEGGQAGA